MKTIVDDEKVLLDASYIKLRNNEPMGLNDLLRIINLLERASMQVHEPTKDEIFGAYNKLITIMQDKFKQP